MLHFACILYFISDDTGSRHGERNRPHPNGAVSRVVYAYNSSDSSSDSSILDDRYRGSRNRITYRMSRHNTPRDPSVINGGFSTNDRNKRLQRQRNASITFSDDDSISRGHVSGPRNISGERERRKHFSRWWRGHDSNNHNRH
ncbi:unnamed protein product [Rodentolepis nana]|uniref:Secreted protein n=1 Tax=Rodentolepis nana TaxID=102285 RepID=A0A0R3TC31_RODNA|nr:unnamed protein product [Rodentolepis nana]